MLDAESGLLYLRARYYDPSIGRFISADPYLGRMAEPVTQNRYIYVQNNPLLYIDPNGLDTIAFQTCVGGGAGVDASFCTVRGIEFELKDEFPYISFGDFFSYDEGAAGATSGVAGSATIGIEITDAKSWQQHLGVGSETGGSVTYGVVAFEGNKVFGENYGGSNWNIGLGLGVPAEVHGRVTYAGDEAYNNAAIDDFGLCPK